MRPHWSPRQSNNLTYWLTSWRILRASSSFSNVTNPYLCAKTKSSQSEGRKSWLHANIHWFLHLKFYCLLFIVSATIILRMACKLWYLFFCCSFFCFLNVSVHGQPEWNSLLPWNFRRITWIRKFWVNYPLKQQEKQSNKPCHFRSGNSVVQSLGMFDWNNAINSPLWQSEAIDHDPHVFDRTVLGEDVRQFTRINLQRHTDLLLRHGTLALCEQLHVKKFTVAHFGIV